MAEEDGEDVGIGDGSPSAALDGVGGGDAFRKFRGRTDAENTLTRAQGVLAGSTTARSLSPEALRGAPVASLSDADIAVALKAAFRANSRAQVCFYSPRARR